MSAIGRVDSWSRADGRVARVGAVCVVVPVRDEETLLAGCLRSLSAAAQATPLPVHVVVVLDRCTDGSVELARSHPGVTCVTTTAGRVGTARRIGARQALRRACALLGAGGVDRVWLASTDADSRVPADWLVRQVALADRGADVVLGTVDLASTGDVATAWRRQYRRDVAPDGTHPHVHGANLGLRASTYLAAGGWPDLPAHEDRQLVAAARHVGATVVSSDALPVATSDRLRGRTPHGVAQDLRSLATRLSTDDDAAA